MQDIFSSGRGYGYNYVVSPETVLLESVWLQTCRPSVLWNRYDVVNLPSLSSSSSSSSSLSTSTVRAGREGKAIVE
jgi:hypothetical protein